MVQPVVLDVLLLLILLLLIPLGFYRGGLREVCSAAGLLLALLIANEWAARWGSWTADRTGIRDDVSQFVIAVGTLTFITAVVGYGAGTAFAYRPGPGGRMYGGLISLLIGAVFLGSVMNFVARFLSDGEYPELIRGGYLTRALSIGLDWVLLLVGMAVVLATLFGMIVRERDAEEYESPVVYQSPGDVAPVPTPPPSVARQVSPDMLEPTTPPAMPVARTTAAVKIKEVRHWEDPAPSQTSDPASGWHRTWPGSSRGNSIRSRSEPRSSPTARPRSQPADQQTTGSQDARIIREWLADDSQEPVPGSVRRPSVEDE